MMSLSEMGERALAASTRLALESTSLVLVQRALEARRRLLEQANIASVQKAEPEVAGK